MDDKTVLSRINGDLKFATEYTYTHLPPWATAVSWKA